MKDSTWYFTSSVDSIDSKIIKDLFGPLIMVIEDMMVFICKFFLGICIIQKHSIKKTNVPLEYLKNKDYIQGLKDLDKYLGIILIEPQTSSKPRRKKEPTGSHQIWEVRSLHNSWLCYVGSYSTKEEAIKDFYSKNPGIHHSVEARWIPLIE